MATYAQIAQQTFDWSREDGSTQSIRLTFEEKDGIAASLDIPLESSVVVTHGDEGDAPNKPIKVSVAEFRLKAKSSTLVSKIRSAQLRDLRLTVENTTSGQELFKGYVVKALTKKIIYEGIDQVQVRAIGSFIDLQAATVLSGERDIDELAGDIGAAIDLDRPLDVYTSLHHDGLSAADPFPLNYQFNQGAAAGGEDSQNLYSATQSMLRSLGQQAFQLNGRLVFADIYERYASSSAINKHADQGGGVYSNTTENLEVALDSSHIVEDTQEAEQLIEVPEYNHSLGLLTRDAVSYTDPAPQSVSIDGQATSSPDAGLVAGGEVINISYSGQLKSSGNGTPTSGNYDRLQVVLTDQITGAVKYYNPVSDAWQDTEVGWDDSFSFTNGVVQEDTWSESNRELAAVPEDFLATVEVRLILDVTFTTGGASELGNNELDSFTMSVSGDRINQVTHTFRSSAAEPVGKALSNVFYIGDKDQFSTQQTFEYDNGTNFVDTELWVSALGNGRLGDVVSKRVGTVVLGSAEKFRLRLRDTEKSISLLSVIKLTDGDGTVRTALPVEIVHDTMKGFYRVVAREVTDGFSSQTDFYATGISASGTTSTGNAGGSEGLSTEEADARYFKQASLLSEVSAGDLPTLYGNIGLDDGSADLDLNSLDINGSGFVDSSRNVTGRSIQAGVGSGTTPLTLFRSGYVNGLGIVLDFKLDSLSNPSVAQIVPHILDTTVGAEQSDLDLRILRGGAVYDIAVFRYDGISLNEDVSVSDTFTINSQLLFTQGNEQLLSTDANVQFNEVDIGGNWKLDSESEGGIERLRIQALGVDDGAELFIQSKGSADLARITLTPDPSPSNYSFVTLESNGSHQIINSSSEGTESTLPLSIRMDGAEALGVDTSRDLTTHANIADDGFSSGWLADGGQGYGITQDPSASAQWNAEFNELLVRGRLKVFELIVKQIATLGGTEILSVAVAEADSVSGSAGSETVTITDPRGFGGTSLAADDLVIVQRVDINDSTLVKQEFRTVSSITGTDVTFTSTSGAPAPSDAIEAGDIIVAYGNTSDSARQNMIFRSVDDQLVIRLQEGVDSYADYNDPSATSKLIIGDLDDAPDLSNGTTPTGRGFFAKGSAYLEGEIVASSGEIGGWSILSDRLTADFGTSGKIGMYTTSTSIIGITKTGAFGGSDNYVRMFAFDDDNWGLQGRDASGDLIFRLGDTNEIAGIEFDDSKLWTGDGTNGYVGLGATSGATDRAFWAGADNADGSGDAAFFVQQDGRIFHDAVGSGVYARTELASFTANSDASSITDQEYSTTVSDTTNGTHTDRDTKVRTVALKRFGADTLIVSGYGRSDGDSNSGATTTTPRARIYIKATDLETSATNEASASLSSGSGQFSISLDISSLTDGNNMLLEVDAEAEIEISGADGSTYTGECYLREDVFIQTATS